jgi:small-conductance mechanosensitive channel
MYYKILFLLTFALWRLVCPPLLAQPRTNDLKYTELIENQKDRINALLQQTSTLRGQLRQENRENRRLAGQLLDTEKVSQARADSINQFTGQVADLNLRLDQTQQAKRQVEATLSQTQTNLDSAQQQIKRLNYDHTLFTTPALLRIYRFTPAETRAIFLRNLTQPESGFQYDIDSTANELKITRRFDDQTEAWWVFDKTLDTVLELTLRFTSHNFDTSRTLVYATANLLQKTRYSSKPFEEQHDPEKIALYRDKTLRLLEGNLRNTSDK